MFIFLPWRPGFGKGVAGAPVALATSRVLAVGGRAAGAGKTGGGGWEVSCEADGDCLVPKKFSTGLVTSNICTHVWSIKYN
jgi:hypothetical protein